MHATATRKVFEHLPEHERLRYAELLRTLDRLRLGCRCEMVGGRDFHIVVGFGLATAVFWMDVLGIDSQLD